MGEMNSKINRAVWLDIPVADLDRACKFYAAVLGVGVEQFSFGEGTGGVLHHEDGNGGCLIVKPEDISETGTLVYYNTDAPAEPRRLPEWRCSE